MNKDKHSKETLGHTGLSGIAALATSGAISIAHSLSHLVPMLAAIEYGAEHHIHHSGNVFMETISHPSFGMAYVAFVPLSIYYTVKERKVNQANNSKIRELESRLRVYESQE